MKRHERLGCLGSALVGLVVLLVLVWLAIYWGSFALDNLREILERVG